MTPLNPQSLKIAPTIASILIAGRAHVKHTEGGDFRQATYRAVRQGLKEAGCRLLEPYYEFVLEVPAESVGRAMADIERLQGSFDAPEQENGMAVLKGNAPVVTMRDYQREVVAYTRGRGRLSLSFMGYEPCHNEEEVIQSIGYDFDTDLQDPAGSVFCSHGAGFAVPWDEVKSYMHIPTPVAVRRALGAEEASALRREPQSRRKRCKPQPPGVLKGFRRPYMRTRSCRRFLNAPMGKYGVRHPPQVIP